MARNAADIPSGNTGGMQKDLLTTDGYPARLVGIVFTGVQNQRPYQGVPKDPVDEVRLTYELSHEFMKDEEGEILADKPRWLTETVPFKSLKLDKAKFTKRYNAIDPSNAGKGVIKNCLSNPVTVLIVNNPGKGKHEGKVFENIGDVSLPPKKLPGYVQPPMVNPPFYYDLNDGDCTLEDFRKQPEFVQEIIMGANDFSTSLLAGLLGAETGKPVSSTPREAPEESTGDEENPY